VRRKTGAEIVLALEQNTCWTRFSYAKELSHLLLDTQSDFTQDPIKLVESLVNGAGLFHPEKDVASEHITLYCATELLVPWFRRAELRQMAASGSSELALAQKCKVPQKVVSFIMNSPYGRYSDTKHAELDEASAKSSDPRSAS
jgi:Zn-dependent peptidase ImmA (M78 family)